MNNLVGGLLTTSDNVQVQALNHRMREASVIKANIANAETPGYRAMGYEFQDQLAAAAGRDGGMALRVSHPKHIKAQNVLADGTLEPEVFVRPTESVSEDGNTVDMDNEMAEMNRNQILYRAAVEFINRKVGVLRYAINGGR